MSAYIRTEGAKSVSKMYVGINNESRLIQKAYIGVNGTARLWYQRGTPLGSLAVGSTVKIAVGGTDYDWLVVQQGIPDAGIYDASCNGTWLLMKDIYTTSGYSYRNDDNTYTNSLVYKYLRDTFFNLIDADIRNAIKQVKIPYKNGTGSDGSLATGSKGLSTKVFLLSGYEVGFTTRDNSYFPEDGVRLAYFSAGYKGNGKRIAYNGSEADRWFLRSPKNDDDSYVWYINTTGDYNWCANYICGVRPCMILPQYALVDDNRYIIGA